MCEILIHFCLKSLYYNNKNVQMNISEYKFLVVDPL